MKRTLIHRYELFSVLFLLILATASVFAQSAPIWTGSISCQLDDEEQGVYQRQEIQTWTLTGAPPANPNGIPIYQATWQAQAQGQLLRAQPGTPTTTSIQWVANVPAPGGQVTMVPIAIRVRADGQWVIGQWRSPMSAPNALNGQRQVLVNGVPQGQPARFSRGLQEWKFPLIETFVTNSTINGISQTQADAGTAEIVHRYGGTSPIATCQWKFTKGGSSAENTIKDTTGKRLSNQDPQSPSGNLGLQNNNPTGMGGGTQNSNPQETQVARTPVARMALGSNPQGPASPSSVNADAGPAAQAAPSGATQGAVQTPSQNTTGSVAVSQVDSAMQRSPSAVATNTGVTSVGGGTSSGGASGSHPQLSNNAAAMQVPLLPAPTGFTARNVGDGSVRFSWQAVRGASKYQMKGTGIAGTGLYVSSNPGSTTTEHVSIVEPPGQTIRNVPLGPGSWQLTAVDSRNIPSQPATAAAIVRYVPGHVAPWLSKTNGAGNESSTRSHYLSLCSACIPGATFGSIAVALGLPSNSAVLSGGRLSTGYGCSWGGGSYDGGGVVCGEAAVYNNVTEFGTTRTTLCLDLLDPANNNVTKYYLCYAKSGDHGLTVIAWSSQNTWFLTFTDPNPADSVFNYTLTTSVNIDSEGPKYAPNACLSCHGGKFDGTHVTGTSMLPLDPGLLQVPIETQTAYSTKLPNIDNILAVNQRVMASGPSAAVKRYLKGLYGADPLTLSNGSSADPDYVPQGWKQQSGFYKMAIKPYCMMCHLATPSNLDFSTYDGFAQNKDLINAEVCSGHTMPHAEYPFKQFWTKDTGNIFLPGYLAAGAGLTNCQ